MLAKDPGDVIGDIDRNIVVDRRQEVAAAAHGIAMICPAGAAVDPDAGGQGLIVLDAEVVRIGRGSVETAA